MIVRILVMLSIKLVPTNPQKKIIEIFPRKIAITNFLKGILDRPQAILIKKAGVNGSAITKTKFEKENVEMRLFNFLMDG